MSKEGALFAALHLSAGRWPPNLGRPSLAPKLTIACCAIDNLKYFLNRC